jgi:hypothetical protein
MTGGKNKRGKNKRGKCERRKRKDKGKNEVEGVRYMQKVLKKAKNMCEC